MFLFGLDIYQEMAQDHDYWHCCLLTTKSSYAFPLLVYDYIHPYSSFWWQFPVIIISLIITVLSIILTV